MDGEHRIDAVWHAAEGVISSCRAGLVCTPGIRFPLAYAEESPTGSTTEGLPRDYGKMFVGYRRADYTAVGWLHTPALPVRLLEISEARVVVVEAGKRKFVGSYVEHSGHGMDQ